MTINWDLVFLVLFILVLYLFYRANKSKFEVQGRFFFIYRSQLGIKLMDKIAKWPRWIHHLFSVISIVAGFLIMVVITYFVIILTFKFVLQPSVNPPALSPVLPGVEVQGLGKIPFFPWIISIFIVATIHEFSHGFVARFFNIKVKSSGFLFFGPVLGAFVEPDEKQLAKKSKYAQLSVFAAGPISNVITGLLFGLILLLISMPIANMYQSNGLVITYVTPGSPADISGMVPGDTITYVDYKPIKNSTENFKTIMDSTKPEQKIRIETNSSVYNVALIENPKSKDKGFIGISVQESLSLKPEYKSNFKYFWAVTLTWISEVLSWLVIVSIGIASFNLLPMGPLDGGRMFLTAMIGLFKNEKKAKFAWGIISIFLLILIIINLIPWIKSLIMFLLSPFIGI